MTSAREDILKKLRAGTEGLKKPFPNVGPQVGPRLPVARVEGDRAALKLRFIAELERVHGTAHPAEDEADARRILLNLLRDKHVKRLTQWEDSALPFRIADDVRGMGIEIMRGQMRELAAADVGITGAACAIAATGTLVLEMGEGRTRAASLLPPVHIAIIKTSQLVPRLEDYLAHQRSQGLQAFHEGSNVVLLTGASRTADIEMNVVYGAHGPLELHVIIVEDLGEIRCQTSDFR